MLGHLMEWFYSGLGGIRQTKDSKGYEHILIKPEPAGDIKWAETKYQTIHGEIVCSWEISDGSLNMKVKTPVNCTATVMLPRRDSGKISEGENPFEMQEGVKQILSSSNQTFIEIGSGEYSFTSQFK